ncbi:MAG: DUF1566 domain-containing protein [Candidatus Omnitrophota bacterium]
MIKKYCSAFTMVELVVVMVIIGLIASFGIPSFNKSIQRSRSRDAIANLTIIRDANRLRVVNGNPAFACAVSTACTTSEINSINGTRTLSIVPQGAVYGCDGVECLATADDNSFKACVLLDGSAADPVCVETTAGACAKNIGTCASLIVPDPCDLSPAIGTVCSDGTLYAGPGYRTTPADEGTMNWATAAATCAAKGADWHLPSKSELNSVLYVNRVALGIGSGSGFWSSTDFNGNVNAWIQFFSNGAQVSNGKNHTYSVRCVRSP